jgi:hypothetical protein
LNQSELGECVFFYAVLNLMAFSSIW